MRITILNTVISVTRKPRLKHNYAPWHAMVAAMKVEDVLEWPNHAVCTFGKCLMADALVKGARKHGMKVKSVHQNGELVIRRIA